VNDGIERRFLTSGGVRVTQPARRAGDSIATVEGMAVVWDALSHDLGGWREKIATGAFTDVLRSAAMPILGLYDHEVGGLLASTAVGTMRLAEDGTGLRFALDLPNTTLGRDVLALVERGDLAGASIGFRPDSKAMAWSKGSSGGPICTIRRVAALREVSLVALPAYPQTTAEVTAAAKPETPAQQRCRQAMEKMRQAVAAAG
jgi:HK97 family phage prohead protease